ncbi:MAG: hypothetical protein JWR42_1021 [Marmoricola sp.]|nr:hypothetical protein [Marmoricola sp.]
MRRPATATRATTSTGPPRTETPRPPTATRARRPGWRNPRLLLGLVLVAGSVVLGARLLAAADDTVGVWAVARDLPAGATVGEADLERRQVRFPDSATADAYLSSSDPVPSGSTLNRPVSQGELLPRSTFARATGTDLVEVPVSVAEDDLPATVRQGSVVDVWVTPEVTTGTGGVRATRVLTDVTVVAVPRATDSLAPRATRQVIVGVPTDRAAGLGEALGGISDGRVVVARKG